MMFCSLSPWTTPGKRDWLQMKRYYTLWYKILNEYENIDSNILFSLKTDKRTKGHKVTLVKEQCRLDIRKYSF